MTNLSKELIDEFSKRFLKRMPIPVEMDCEYFMLSSFSQMENEGIKKCTDYLTQWLQDFANRPISERENAFNEVANIRTSLTNLMQSKV